MRPVMRPLPTLVCAVAAAVLAPAVAEAGPPVDAGTPRTPPADRDHLALQAYLGMGSSNAVRSGGEVLDGVTGQVGVIATMTISHAVLGVLIERTPFTLDFSEDHTAFLAGYDAKVARHLHVQALGEVGRHGFEDLGQRFLSTTPTGGETSAELLYAGARLAGSIDTNFGLYFTATLVGRFDLSDHDARITVRDSSLFPPCSFGCPDGTPQPTTRTEVWELGGTEVAAVVGGGWKF
jgi:hypothetical protein